MPKDIRLARFSWWLLFGLHLPMLGCKERVLKETPFAPKLLMDTCFLLFNEYDSIEVCRFTTKDSTVCAYVVERDTFWENLNDVGALNIDTANVSWLDFGRVKIRSLALVDRIRLHQEADAPQGHIEIEKEGFKTLLKYNRKELPEDFLLPVELQLTNQIGKIRTANIRLQLDDDRPKEHVFTFFQDSIKKCDLFVAKERGGKWHFVAKPILEIFSDKLPIPKALEDKTFYIEVFKNEKPHAIQIYRFDGKDLQLSGSIPWEVSEKASPTLEHHLLGKGISLDEGGHVKVKYRYDLFLPNPEPKNRKFVLRGVTTEAFYEYNEETGNYVFQSSSINVPTGATQLEPRHVLKANAEQLMKMKKRKNKYLTDFEIE